MRKLYFLVALVAIFSASPVFANGNGPPNCHPVFGCQGGGDDDPGSNTNTNTNTATGVGVGVGIAGGGDASSDATAFGGAGFGGDATAFGGHGGDAEVGNGFGNFSPESESNSFSSAHQGQAQGQEQGQGQGQFGYVKTDVEVEGDTHVTDIDNDFPVNTAAPVFAGNCSQGVSAQTQGFGGSIASGNSVCDYIAVAGAYIAGGDRDEAFRVLGKAEKAADWRFVFSRVRMVLTLGLL